MLVPASWLEMAPDVFNAIPQDARISNIEERWLEIGPSFHSLAVSFQTEAAAELVFEQMKLAWRKAGAAEIHGDNFGRSASCSGWTSKLLGAGQGPFRLRVNFYSTVTERSRGIQSMAGSLEPYASLLQLSIPPHSDLSMMYHTEFLVSEVEGFENADPDETTQQAGLLMVGDASAVDAERVLGDEGYVVDDDGYWMIKGDPSLVQVWEQGGGFHVMRCSSDVLIVR